MFRFPHVALCTLLVISSCPLWAQEAPQPREAEQSEHASPADDLSPEESEYLAQMTALLQSLERKTGAITIDQAGATLNVPESFYFLNAEDANKVLVDIWGNPPGQPVLGMLFPATMTPFDPESWAVTIEYEEDGYVSDADAADIDYADLLTQMQKDTREESQYRQEQGYDAIELIGWASPPFYDSAENKLHWAKELNFGGQGANTLNYNIRVLGRRGVLVLNFIAGMEQKTEIENNLDSVLAMANFDDGSKYSDFNPDIDQVAAYGLGALVAGKVIAKTGVLAVVLMFLKKFGVVILIALGALIKSIWGRRKSA